MQTLTISQSQRKVVPAFLQVALATLLIILSGRLHINLPFTPVPIALQPHTVLLMAALLGFRKGTMAVALFLLQGLMGFHVFSSLMAGPAIFLGPTGGYIIGYLPAAALMGWMAPRLKENKVLLFLSFCAANLVIFTFGLAHLSNFVPGFKALLLAGFAPFILGDLIKNLLVTKTFSKLLSKHRV